MFKLHHKKPPVADVHATDHLSEAFAPVPAEALDMIAGDKALNMVAGDKLVVTGGHLHAPLTLHVETRDQLAELAAWMRRRDIRPDLLPALERVVAGVHGIVWVD